jgi:hypothetical protein
MNDNLIYFVDIKQACQMLIKAAEHDMTTRSELEKAGLLRSNKYNPQMREIHENNAHLLQNFLTHYGWPMPSQFGRKVHKSAWLIAIHAISIPSVLHQALETMKEALNNGESVALEYAKLYDRVGLYEGRGQYYGTQFFPSPDGWYAQDLIDPEYVDNRRSQLGLNSFADGKKECGADKGGFITLEEMEQEEINFTAFLKECGWKK